jgi:hypothetical protein
MYIILCNEFETITLIITFTPSLLVYIKLVANHQLLYKKAIRLKVDN